jgi:hypothetical protein
MEGAGKALYDEFLKLIKSSDGGLLQTWSCASDKELERYDWWY